MAEAAWRLTSSNEQVTSDQAAELVRRSVESGRLDIWFEHSADRSLSVTTNGARAMLVLWGRRGNDEGEAAIDSSAGEGESGGYVLQNGQMDTYPDNQTVPLDEAIEAVRYIIDHGIADPRLEWRAW